MTEISTFFRYANTIIYSEQSIGISIIQWCEKLYNQTTIRTRSQTQTMTKANTSNAPTYKSNTLSNMKGILFILLRPHHREWTTVLKWTYCRNITGNTLVTRKARNEKEMKVVRLDRMTCRRVRTNMYLIPDLLVGSDLFLHQIVLLFKVFDLPHRIFVRHLLPFFSFTFLFGKSNIIQILYEDHPQKRE